MFFLPLETNNPTRHRHYVLWTLVAVNVLVFGSTWILMDHVALLRAYGMRPARATLVTALTSTFLHGGWLHLIGNMWFLIMFGDNVEDVLGPLCFLISYLLGGVASAYAYVAFHAASTVPSVGASGAISAVMAMYMVLFPRAKAKLVVYVGRWTVGTIPMTIQGAIVAWFVEQMLLMLVIELTPELNQFVGVAFSAHAGGFFAGCLLGWLFLKLGYRKRYAAKTPRHWLLGHVPRPAGRRHAVAAGRHS